MSKSVIIFGAGGLGREVLLLIQDMAHAETDIICRGFAVDVEVDAPSTVDGIRVHRGLDAFVGSSEIYFVVALGNPVLRRRVVGDIERLVGARFATLVHPRASVGGSSSLGCGTIIMGNSSITADVHVGSHVLVNPLASIAHDCVLEDFATLAPSVALAGGVRVREGGELGVGSCVLPRREIGAWSMVGAGAVVVEDVPPNSTVAGVPARVIKSGAPARRKNQDE